MPWVAQQRKCWGVKMSDHPNFKMPDGKFFDENRGEKVEFISYVDDNGEQKDYGYVVLRKQTFKDKLKIRSSILNLDINKVAAAGGKVNEEDIEVDQLLYWNTLLSVKALPNAYKTAESDPAYIDFQALPNSEKEKYFDSKVPTAVADQLFSLSTAINRFDQAVAKKKLQQPSGE